MPRGARIDFPGAFHHVCARGIEKREIFRDDRDRDDLRRRILLNLNRANASCLAWAFLPNHIHLLFQSDDGVLSRFMHRLMSGYSIYFNRRHDRAGHLFQNRFQSSLIQSESYLLEAIRYIHLNPLRAGIVRTLDDLANYRWSMHGEILRSRGATWGKFSFLQDQFGRDGGELAINRYLEFMEEGVRRSPSVSFSDVDGPEDEPFLSASEDGSMPKEEHGCYREFLRVVAASCRKQGIPIERFGKDRKGRGFSIVRRETLKQCVVGKGMDRRQVCSWLGITDAGGAYLLRTAQRRKALLPHAGEAMVDIPPGEAPA
jgi:REP element-mobilizing transposase RayT